MSLFLLFSMVSQHQELLALVKQQAERIDALEQQNLLLLKKVDELTKQLRAYENAHTPPSKSKKKKEPREPNGKLGAEKGHKKWDRKHPKTTQTIEYSEDECPHCKNKLGQPTQTTRKITEDIPEPTPVIVTEHLINHYHCNKCGKNIVAKNNVPNTCFGTNTQIQTILLRYKDRLPLRKVIQALERQGLNMSNVNVHKISNKIGKQLENEYKQQIQTLRTSAVVHADETTLKISGVNHWLWTFTNQKVTVFVVRRSRGQTVPIEILGKNFQGILVCDGWQGYKQFKKLQRCWAHIIRESKDLLEHKHYECHHNNLKNIFKKLKQLRAKPPPLEKRLQHKQELEQRLEWLCDALDGNKKYKTFAVKLRNAIPHLFTCLIHLFVDTTNNHAERILREPIVIRKIIGGLRSDSGAKAFEKIMTMLTTWEQQQKPLYATLKQKIITISKT